MNESFTRTLIIIQQWKKQTFLHSYCVWRSAGDSLLLGIPSKISSPFYITGAVYNSSYISPGKQKTLHLFVNHCVNYSFSKCKIARNKQSWFNSDWNTYFILPQKLLYPNYALAWWVGDYQHRENIFNWLLLVTGKAWLGKKEKCYKSVSIGYY